jgi:hypothetical protein
MNPCFDPTFVSLQTLPLPAGPHSYTLYSNSIGAPDLIITHDPWSYTTIPIPHTLCGTIDYTATFEGTVADLTTMPNVVYSSNDRTFGIYSEDFALIGMRSVTVSASLTDYPTIFAGPESI